MRPHDKRLEVKDQKEFYKLKDMPKELRNYYKLKDCPNMLISPQANMNEDGYLCCTICDKSIDKRDKKKKPPKFSIASGVLLSASFQN